MCFFDGGKSQKTLVKFCFDMPDVCFLVSSRPRGEVCYSLVLLFKFVGLFIPIATSIGLGSSVIIVVVSSGATFATFFIVIYWWGQEIWIFGRQLPHQIELRDEEEISVTCMT